MSTAAPIADQSTLPVARFVQENSQDDLPIAVPVRVIDPQRIPVVVISSAPPRQPPSAVKPSTMRKLRWILLLLAVVVAGAGAYILYRFVIEPAINAQSTSNVASSTGITFTPTRFGSNGTRTPTVSKAPTPPTPEVYGIELVYAPTPLPTSIMNAFESAKAKWQSILVEPGISPRPPAGPLCGHSERMYNGVERIDDLEIWVEVGDIDGPGQVLGYAGPCGLVVSGTWRSVTGEMVFDSADLLSLEQDGTLVDVITHEMGHVLGLGSFWGQSYAKLVNPPNQNYLGTNGQQGYQTLGGVGSPPVETDGGTGTAFS
jgi:hypothetical protein